MMSLFAELKRRNVFKVAIAYIVVGWLIMQVGEVMAPALQLPDWVLSTLAFFVILGFPIAMVFAWAFEMTPEGLKRESEVDRSQSTTTKTGRKLDFIIIGVLAVAVIFLLTERFTGNEEPASVEVTQDAPVATTMDEGRKAIAVLPFDNLSTEEENAFFAAGVHEDILTYLTRIADLKVNSRTSVLPYADSDLPLAEIATALGAAYIVEGSVRKAGNRVRVTAQLIDTATDEHLWAENFDRDLTDIFEIQTAVAQDIVSAVQAELLPQAERELNRRTTDNIEAYEYFLLARQSMQLASSENTWNPETEPLLQRAVELDPDYAQAWALLAISHGDRFWFGENRTNERLEAMKSALDRAMELQPDLPEAHLALATYHYRGFYDYPAALEELLRVKEQIPNDTILHFNLGLTLRRLGRYDEAIDAFETAVRLDSGNEEAWAEWIGTASNNNRAQRALEAMEQLPEHMKHKQRFQGEQALVYLRQFGDIERGRALLTQGETGTNWYYNHAAHLSALWSKQYEKAAKAAVAPGYLNRITRGMGDTEASMALSLGGLEDRARDMLVLGETRLRSELERPTAQNYAWPHAALGRNLALQGRYPEALESCDRAQQILPLEKDKTHGSEIAVICAYVLAMSGDHQAALTELEALFELGHDLSPWHLSFDPQWNMLRGDPRFEAMASQTDSFNAELRDRLP